MPSPCLGAGRAAHVRLDSDGHPRVGEQHDWLHVPGEHLAAGESVTDGVLRKTEPDRLHVHPARSGLVAQSFDQPDQLDQAGITAGLGPRSWYLLREADLEVAGDQCRRHLRAADVDCQDGARHLPSATSTALAAITSPYQAADAFGVRTRLS